MGFASDELIENHAAVKRGEKARIETDDGQVYYVDVGSARTLLPDGRTLVVVWGETYPPKPLEWSVHPPAGSVLVSDIVHALNDAAASVARIDGLSPRDKNAIIGQLRSIAGQLRGLEHMGGFDPVPFAPPRPPANEPR